jgi:hypothetical protein
LVFGGLSRYERPPLRVPPFSRRPTVKRPIRLSMPTRSERIRERRVTSSESSSIGICTRRPSLVTTTATRRRSKPFEVRTVPAVYGAGDRFATTGSGAAIGPGPAPRSDRSGEPARAGSATVRGTPGRWPTGRRLGDSKRPPDVPAASGMLTNRLVSSSGDRPPRGDRCPRAGCWCRMTRKRPRTSCSWLRPPHSRTGREGQRCQQHEGPGEARQVRLHSILLPVNGMAVPLRRSAAGRSPGGDPWLCVPASRRVCPGRPLQGRRHLRLVPGR